MVERLLSTSDVLDSGILGKPPPKTDIPEDREHHQVYVDEWRTDEVRAKLDAGVVVECPEYYGIPVAWKDGDQYRGILLQYREVTADKTFATVEEAAEWLRDTAFEVAG